MQPDRRTLSGQQHSRKSRKSASNAKAGPSKVAWYNPDDLSGDEAVGEGSRAVPPRKVNMKSNVFTLTDAGKIRGRTAYVAADASPKKKRPRVASPTWNDSPQPANASPEEDLPLPWVDAAYMKHLNDTTVPSSKKKMNPRKSRSNPLKIWTEFVDNFLGELLRQEGRAGHVEDVCLKCGIGTPQFKCQDCFGGHLLCQQCTISSHACQPLHRVDKWNGTFFEHTSLKALGLRIQLGHGVGDCCVNPKRAFNDDFIVVDSHGIHQVGLDFCDCETAQPLPTQLLRARWFPATVSNPKSAATFNVLEHFQLLSFEGKTTTFEFYHTLARETDNTGVNRPKDRYPSFLRMVREWRLLCMLKRGARGHDPGGVGATQEGELAVLCPACPQPGKNLPAGWEDVPESLRWIYTLYLAIDANFRLKRKAVSSEKADPSLAKGWSYFVEQSKYAAHIAKFANLPQEKSTCTSHNAVNNADSTPGRGIASTGVGAIFCARHEIKLPRSVGDLQKGERYANMDYLFFSSIQHANFVRLVVSYDIVCQWHKNLWDRMRTYDHSLHLDHEGRMQITFLVPKFHLPAHIEYCHNNFSWNLAQFVGNTDGEAPERNWSDDNDASPSTREMGPGSRRDALDARFTDDAWTKITRLGILLLRRIKTAVVEAAEQEEAHELLTLSMPDNAVDEWTTMVEAWERDNRVKNPFMVEVKTLTQAAVRGKLAEEEHTEIIRGDAIVVNEDVSPSVFINSGIELEDLQRRMKMENAALGPHSTDRQRTHVKERLNTLLRKIQTWSKVQQSYMPGAIVLRERNARASPDEHDPTNIPLFLPSSIKQQAICNNKLRKYEWCLRIAQANDALNEIRHNLRLRSHLYKFKDRFHRGQRANTRSRATISRVQDRVEAAADKYDAARKALETLAAELGETGWEGQLKVLNRHTDLRGLSEAGYEQSDGKEKLLDRHIHPRGHKQAGDRPSEGRRKLSWIWLTPGVELDADGNKGDKGVHEALQVEWCRSRARAMRWREEVTLLQEEMRRVLQFLTWQAGWWKAKGMGWSMYTPEAREGLVAYAERQASVRVSLHDHFVHLWRFVPQYVSLGIDTVEGEEEEIVGYSDDDEDDEELTAAMEVLK